MALRRRWSEKRGHFGLCFEATHPPDRPAWPPLVPACRQRLRSSQVVNTAARAGWDGAPSMRAAQGPTQAPGSERANATDAQAGSLLAGNATGAIGVANIFGKGIPGSAASAMITAERANGTGSHKQQAGTPRRACACWLGGSRPRRDVPLVEALLAH